MERRIARQAHQTRRRRQIQAGVGASLALVLIVVGLTWLVGGFDPEPETPPPTVATGTCTWDIKDASGSSIIIETGHPPTTGEARSGTETLTIKTNLGEVQATIDLGKAPCTAASLKFLSQQKYYDGTRCHRLSTISKVLHCGAKNPDGTGEPSYSFANEDTPTEPISDPPASPSGSPSGSPSSGASTFYAKGTIVLANAGKDTNAGQFYIVYDDGSDLSAAYSIVGMVTDGLGFIEQAAKAGALNAEGTPSPEGKPNLDVIIEQLYLGPPPAATPSATPTATASATVAP
jgi:peptidyl-prolyl cis-trans isomerase B (cyclophilin B)